MYPSEPPTVLIKTDQYFLIFNVEPLSPTLHPLDPGMCCCYGEDTVKKKEERMVLIILNQNWCSLFDGSRHLTDKFADTLGSHQKEARWT